MKNIVLIIPEGAVSIRDTLDCLHEVDITPPLH